MENRRKNSALQAIVSDPYRKLASIALAIGLWYFLDTQVTKDLKIPARLRAVNQALRTVGETESGSSLLVNLPTNIVSVRGFVNPATERPLTHVEIRFKGLTYLIDNLEASGPIELRVGPFDDRKWDEIEVLEFSTSDIRTTDRMLQNVTLQMDPPRVRVNLERNGHIPFSLKPGLVEVQFRTAQEDERLRSRLRMDRAEFTKELVKVTGPESHLQKFEQSGRKPFLALVDPINSERQVTGTLTLNIEDLDLVMDSQPSITIELAPNQKEFSFDLPIRVDDIAVPKSLRGRYRPKDSDTKLVPIKASGEVQSVLDLQADDDARAMWARQHLRLAVWIAPRADEQSYPPELLLEARLELLGPLGARVDPVHYGLASSVPITLVRQ